MHSDAHENVRVSNWETARFPLPSLFFLAIMGRIEHVTDSGAKKESGRVWIMGINTELQRPRKPISPHLSRLS